VSAITLVGRLLGAVRDSPAGVECVLHTLSLTHTHVRECMCVCVFVSQREVYRHPIMNLTARSSHDSPVRVVRVCEGVCVCDRERELYRYPIIFVYFSILGGMRLWVGVP